MFSHQGIFQNIAWFTSSHWNSLYKEQVTSRFLTKCYDFHPNPSVNLTSDHSLNMHISYALDIVLVQRGNHHVLFDRQWLINKLLVFQFSRAPTQPPEGTKEAAGIRLLVPGIGLCLCTSLPPEMSGRFSWYFCVRAFRSGDLTIIEYETTSSTNKD